MRQPVDVNPRSARCATLRATPLAKVVQAEIAAARKPAESAKRTDAHIRSGLHPLAAFAASRRDMKAAKPAKAGGAS